MFQTFQIFRFYKIKKMNYFIILDYETLNLKFLFVSFKILSTSNSLKESNYTTYNCPSNRRTKSHKELCVKYFLKFFERIVERKIMNDFSG